MRHRWIHLLALTVLASALLLAACQVPPSAAGTPSASTPITLADIPRIAPQELKAQLDAGEKITIVDARSQASYELRHIPGALSIPLTEIAQRLDELPQSGETVFYCT